MVGLKSEALNLHSFGLPAYGCKNSLGCTEVLQKHGILWWYGSSQYSLRHTGLETGLQPLLVRENEYSLTVCWRLMAVTREMTDKLPVTHLQTSNGSPPDNYLLIRKMCLLNSQHKFPYFCCRLKCVWK